jgi:hypothetical protein
VKVYGLTIKLPLILLVLRRIGVDGMCGVAVKCVDITQNTDSEDSSRGFSDAQARKRGEQTGLDTLVVHAVNDDH